MKTHKTKMIRDSARAAFERVRLKARGLPSATDDNFLVDLLKAEGPRLLHKFDIQALILSDAQAALEAEDGNFFIRLGRAIQDSKAGKIKRPTITPVEHQLEGVLSSCWEPRPNYRWPGLCVFTDEALMDWCNLFLGGNRTLATIRKTRQRLKLVKAKPVVKAVSRNNGKIVFPTRSGQTFTPHRGQTLAQFLSTT